ncbi:MAG: hypothetical protein ACMUIP_08520 [bacterium]
MSKKLSYLLIIAIFMFGCGGSRKQLYMMEDTGDTRVIDFPSGTMGGKASANQARVLAQIFIDSHNMAMRERGYFQSAGKRPIENDEALQSSINREEAAMRQNFDMADNSLDSIIRLSKQQGTGEITIFFPAGVSTHNKNSLEFERLVRFLDYLSRESRGRDVIFISIGSASATGNPQLNLKLAQKRAEFPKDIIDKYLINIPHEFFKVYGVGDIYSPKKVSWKEHGRYQHTRLIAVYNLNQMPVLPAKPDTTASSQTSKKDSPKANKVVKDEFAAQLVEKAGAKKSGPELEEFPDKEVSPEELEENAADEEFLEEFDEDFEE